MLDVDFKKTMGQRIEHEIKEARQFSDKTEREFIVNRDGKKIGKIDCREALIKIRGREAIYTRQGLLSLTTDELREVRELLKL